MGFGFMTPGTPAFNHMWKAMSPEAAKLIAGEKGESSATKAKAGTSPSPRQASPSGKKGGDRRGDLLAGGGRRELAGGKNEGNLGKKTLLGG